jgi:uncharacterized RDD family membrane protein YckC
MPVTLPPDRNLTRQGHYAGAASRLLAFGADVGISWGLYTLGVAAVSLTVGLITGHSYSLSHHQWVALAAVVIWEFLYFALQWAASGRTAGMALFGIRVVQTDGSRLTSGRAIARTFAFPLSILLLGLGFVGILTNRQRQALHDRIAGTAVIYAWDARAAHLRWLAEAQDASAPPRSLDPTHPK